MGGTVALGSEVVVVLPLFSGHSGRCVPSAQVVISPLELASGLLVVDSGGLVVPASARRLVPELVLVPVSLELVLLELVPLLVELPSLSRSLELICEHPPTLASPSAATTTIQ